MKASWMAEVQISLLEVLGGLAGHHDFLTRHRQIEPCRNGQRRPGSRLVESSSRKRRLRDAPHPSTPGSGIHKSDWIAWPAISPRPRIVFTKNRWTEAVRSTWTAIAPALSFWIR
jgi:hypothetical protein